MCIVYSAQTDGEVSASFPGGHREGERALPEQLLRAHLSLYRLQQRLLPLSARHVLEHRLRDSLRFEHVRPCLRCQRVRILLFATGT